MGQSRVDAETSSNGLLQSRRRHNLHFREVVELYLLQRKASGLDGSVHPALDATSPNVRLDSKKCQWVTVTRSASEVTVSSLPEQKDPQRHKWKDDWEPEDVDLVELYKDVQKNQEEFRGALKEFQKEADPKLKLGIDFDKIYSVDDVLVAITDAKTEYEMKEKKGFFAPIRKAFRRLGDNSDAAKAYAKLLPGESLYFSLICGALVFIIQAAGRLRLLNNEIVLYLSQVPAMIDQSQRALRVFGKSPALRENVSKLYIHVIETLSQILGYYRQHAIPRTLSVTFSQNSFKQDLLDSVTKCTMLIDAVRSETALSHTEMDKETNIMSKKNYEIEKAVFEKTGVIEEDLGEVREHLGEVKGDLGEVREDLGIMKQDLDALKDMMEGARKSALNGIYGVFVTADPSQGDSLAHSSPSISPCLTPSKSPSAAAKRSKARKTLIKRLSSSHNIPKIDRLSNLEHGLAMTTHDQNRAVYIIQSQTLHGWLKTPQSSVLLVNGQKSGSGGLRSAVSFVSAKLADALRQSRKSAAIQIINLHFFCAEHTNWRVDPDHGPTGLMSSLLAQLLTQFRYFDIAGIKDLQKLNADRFDDLLRMFMKLVAELPEDTMVFCIIDSLSVYEAGETAEDVEMLVERLIYLTRKMRGKNHCVFKLFLTAPFRLQSDSARGLDGEEILHVPARVEKRGGFTDMKWDLGAGQDISDLSGLMLDD